MTQKKRAKTSTKPHTPKTAKRPAHHELITKHPNLIWLLPLLLILALISLKMTHEHPLFDQEINDDSIPVQQSMPIPHPTISPAPTSTSYPVYK